MTGWGDLGIQAIETSLVAREINKSMPMASDWPDFVYFSIYVQIQVPSLA